MSGHGVERAGSEDEEDDYLTMTIMEPEQTKFESSSQRRARIKKEAEERSRPKSKVDREAEDEKIREEALGKGPDGSSKGFKMLSKLGYKPGSTLGAEGSSGKLDARLEPIGIEIRDSRAGIGHDADKKRKFREQMDREAKRIKTEEVDFRLRVAKERQDRRNEGLWRGAMSVLEKIEEEKSDASGHEDASKKSAHSRDGRKGMLRRPLTEINLLYRSLVKQREQAEQRRRLRHDLEQSLPRAGDLVGDVDEPVQSALNEVEDDLEQEDHELTSYEAFDPALRVDRVVRCLRDKYHYCFWCKAQYQDTEMKGCPGSEEDDHD